MKTEYLFLSDQTILQLPTFHQLSCSLDLPVSGINFGNVGLVWEGGERRLVVGGGVTGGVNNVEQWWVRAAMGWQHFQPPSRNRWGGGRGETGGQNENISYQKFLSFLSVR